MALTLHSTPQELTPAYNDQIFTALSNQIAIADFKYIVTVVVNGDVANYYIENILQRPDGWCVFNAKEWVKNYIEHYFNPNDTGIVVATNKSVIVQFQIEEYYSGAIQSNTVYNYTAFDACLTDYDFKNYDFNDYLFGEVTDKYLLTDGEINNVDKSFNTTQPIWLYFFNGITDPVTDIVVLLRNGSTTVGGFSASIPFVALSHPMFCVNVGGLTGAVSGYNVRVSFNGASGLIKRFVFDLENKVSDYQNYTIYYLDRNSNIKSKHFDKLSTKNSSKKVSDVILNKNKLNTTTGVYGSESWHRDRHVVSTDIENTITLNTDWITKEQSTLLKDLWSSPIKYLWDGLILKAVSFQNSPYEEKTEGLDPLFNYTVTVDLGSETVQRGI